MKKYVLFAAIVALSACGSKPEATETSATANDTTAAPVELASADAAPAAFGQCATCHSVDKGGANGIGPNLHGVIGRKAGSAEGFSYSPATKDWGQSWTEANLDKFITNPRALIAGNKMSYAGQSDPAKRKEIIDWLKKNS